MNECILRFGKKYRALESYEFGTSIFKKGGIYIFQSGGFSRYDDCFLFEFDDEKGNRNVYRLPPEADEQEILRFFKEVQ